jgi:hypothetical protein
MTAGGVEGRKAAIFKQQSVAGYQELLAIANHLGGPKWLQALLNEAT